MINSTNKVSNPVKWDQMLVKGLLGVNNHTPFVMVDIFSTEKARALIFLRATISMHANKV